MSRVLVLVEGQTEEVFLKQVLAPRLAERRVYLTPTIHSTKARKSGKRFKGGVSKYSRLRRDLVRLLGDSDIAAVTTMLDYYGLPMDFPGQADLPESADPYEKVSHLEAELKRDIADDRLLPYLSLHEFEALLFAGPEHLIGTFRRVPIKAKREFEDIAASTPPEEINDGAHTHPAARLESWFPGFQKTFHGRLVTGRIGLPKLRETCPHFNGWIERLEALGDDDHIP